MAKGTRKESTLTTATTVQIACVGEDGAGEQEHGRSQRKRRQTTDGTQTGSECSCVQADGLLVGG